MLRAMPGVFCVGEMLDWDHRRLSADCCLAGGLAVADGVAARRAMRFRNVRMDGFAARRGQVADHLADHGWRAVLEPGCR